MGDYDQDEEKQASVTNQSTDSSSSSANQSSASTDPQDTMGNQAVQEQMQQTAAEAEGKTDAEVAKEAEEKKEHAEEAEKAEKASTPIEAIAKVAEHGALDAEETIDILKKADALKSPTGEAAEASASSLGKMGGALGVLTGGLTMYKGVQDMMAGKGLAGGSEVVEGGIAAIGGVAGLIGDKAAGPLGGVAGLINGGRDVATGLDTAATTNNTGDAVNAAGKTGLGALEMLGGGLAVAGASAEAAVVGSGVAGYKLTTMALEGLVDPYLNRAHTEDATQYDKPEEKSIFRKAADWINDKTTDYQGGHTEKVDEAGIDEWEKKHGIKR